MLRGAEVEVNLENLSYNIRKIKKLIGRRPLIAVIKADAYGHGAIEVAKTISSQGIKQFGVAFINEAVQLRESGIKEDLIVFFDQQITKEIIHHRLTSVINSIKYARALNRFAIKNRVIIDCHINIDTGMGRMGLNGNLLKDVKEILQLENLRIKGIMSHFSDADLVDRSFAMEQVEKLQWLKEKLIGVIPDDCIFHIANSAATVTLPDAYFDAVRPGLVIYGVNPFSDTLFRPVMRVKTMVLGIRRLKKGTSISYGRTFITTRDTVVGVLPVGYADGLIRSASNSAEFLVKGKRVPVVGRVCMDLTIVDLTGVKGVREGDEVVIIGQQGKEHISASELADRAGTIPYEVLTSFGRINRRHYLNGESSS